MSSAVEERAKIREEELTRLVAARFRMSGVDPDAAAGAAQVLVLAEMMGIRTHGVGRVPTYCARLDAGGIDARAVPAVDRVAAGLLMVDGRNGLGPAVAHAALDAAMTVARETGISAAFVRRGNHFGAAAPYCLIAAEAGFASLIFSNSTPTMAPPGATAARFGNNPMGFGVPGGGGSPVVIDLSLSAVARSRIRAAAREGTPIPEGWAVDASGFPVTDAAAAMQSLLVPMGGHKGYALAVAVDMLVGVLGGAAFLSQIPDLEREPSAIQNLGHAMILIDAAHLVSVKDLASRLDEVAVLLTETPVSQPGRPVRLPGSRAIASLLEARQVGISIDTRLASFLFGSEGP